MDTGSSSQRAEHSRASPPRPRRHRVHPNARHPRPPDSGPRTSPPQRRRTPARHRTVHRPTAFGARASTKQSTPAPRSLNRPPNGAIRSPGRRRPAGTPEPPPAPARLHQHPLPHSGHLYILHNGSLSGALSYFYIHIRKLFTNCRSPGRRFPLRQDSFFHVRRT